MWAWLVVLLEVAAVMGASNSQRRNAVTEQNLRGVADNIVEGKRARVLRKSNFKTSFYRTKKERINFQDAVELIGHDTTLKQILMKHELNEVYACYHKSDSTIAYTFCSSPTEYCNIDIKYFTVYNPLLPNDSVWVTNNVPKCSTEKKTLEDILAQYHSEFKPDSKYYESLINSVEDLMDQEISKRKNFDKTISEMVCYGSAEDKTVNTLRENIEAKERERNAKLEDLIWQLNLKTSTVNFQAKTTDENYELNKNYLEIKDETENGRHSRFIKGQLELLRGIFLTKKRAYCVPAPAGTRTAGTSQSFRSRTNATQAAPNSEDVESPNIKDQLF